MLREEQLDLRRQRAAQSLFRIENLGRNKVFSDYRVININNTRNTAYKVSIRGFNTGENFCECPDFKINTLGSCKHIIAVLDVLQKNAQGLPKRKHAQVTRPEIIVRYDTKLRLAILLPHRPSPALLALGQTYFDSIGDIKPNANLEELMRQVEKNPEEITVYSDALDFINNDLESQKMAIRENELRTLYANDQWHPKLLQTELLPYQVEGALFLAHRSRCILADDMGLGKTIQAMAAVELMARERNLERVLVVTPASLKFQWVEEIRKFTSRQVQVIDGSEKERENAYSTPTFYRIVNYDIVKHDLLKLNAWEPDLVILDEAQRIKNWEAETTREVKKLKSKFAFVLTGTPLENRLEELYSIVEFVDARRLGPAFQFLEDHRIVDAAGKTTGYRNLDQVREKLKPILLRRSRDKILHDLPEKVDTPIRLELSTTQQKLHSETMEQLAKLVSRKNLSKVDHNRLLKILARLRLICNCASLADDQTSPIDSPKITELIIRVKDLILSGTKKIVVFCESKEFLVAIEAMLKKNSLGYVFLHGQLPSSSRASIVKQFRDNPETMIFLSTDAGSTGLNLQFADTLFNLDIPWNPAVLKQRMARIHRMGQKQPVQSFQFIMQASIEEKVLLSLQKKNQLFENLFGKTEDQIELSSSLGQEFLDQAKIWTQPQEPPTSSAPFNSANLIATAIPFFEALLGCLKTPEGNLALEAVPESLRTHFFSLCKQISDQNERHK
ncbi:MAG: helicase Snf2 [Planctomycetota bacterium]|nr:MAG: helicase Snf2 [Planctomycetota bacterium]